MKHTVIEEKEFAAARVEQNGSRFLIANGYMGYRGTLEEFGKEQLVALNMAGLFDKNGDAWRESVNLPNPFYTAVAVNGEILSPLTADVTAHRQWLAIGEGIHGRETSFRAGVTVTAERFVSMAEETLAALSYTVRAEKDITLSLSTGVDADVWSINGQHFTVDSHEGGLLRAHTGELGTPIEIYEQIVGAANENTLTLRAGESFTFYKLVGVYWGEGCQNARARFAALAARDYAAHRTAHTAVWQEMWQAADVQIEGDEKAQLALRYSLYHLLSIAPRNSTKCGIPARGLSGQVYKGASFWDTEMFMLPFFSFADPALARNLVRFRIATLAGAQKKAHEFGYEGAFYPWECQETG
jgi:trehalose/maltose hydrolase-like predicted phosphorylase